RLRAARFALNLEGETLATLTLEAEDDAAAAALEHLLGRTHAFLKKSYPELRKDLARKLPPKVSKPVLDVFDQFPELVSIARAGDRVTVTLKAPAALAGLGPVLG